MNSILIGEDAKEKYHAVVSHPSSLHVNLCEPSLK